MACLKILTRKENVVQSLTQNCSNLVQLEPINNTFNVVSRIFYLKSVKLTNASKRAAKIKFWGLRLKNIFFNVKVTGKHIYLMLDFCLIFLIYFEEMLNKHELI